MICNLIIHTAMKYGISALLLTSIIQTESTFNQYAVNPPPPQEPTSFGIGQLTIATAKERCQLERKQIFDLQKNLDCAARIIRENQTRYDGDLTKVVSAYQAGSYTPKNKWYVDKVKKHVRENYCQI